MVKLKKFRYRFPNIPERLKGWMVHPAVVSLLATTLIVLILPNKFPKFQLEKTEFCNQERLVYNQWVFLDDNRESDNLIAYQNDIGTSALGIMLFPGNRIKQWNFNGSFKFGLFPYFLLGDFDRNHQKEVYVFTVSGDSILLHVISNFKNQQDALANRFISKIRLKKGECDPYIVPAEMDDLNNDGYDELIFGLGNGFSIYPRKIFGYDVKNDSLYESEDNLYSITSILQADLTGDGKNEFFPLGYSSENMLDSSFTYHDRSCWLMALDRNLKFLFPPKEFKKVFTRMYVYPLKSEEQKNTLIGIHLDHDTIGNPNLLFSFNRQGEIMDSVKIPRLNGIPFVIPCDNRIVLACPLNKDSLLLYNDKLQPGQVVNPGFLAENPQFLDLDGDGENEWVFMKFRGNNLIVTRELFKHPAEVELDLGSNSFANASVRYQSGKCPVLVINTQKYLYNFEYRLHPMYYWRFGIYGAIYLGLFLFALIIRKIQRTQLNRRYQAEKKITELQVKIIRNQLDPHFAMNAINSAVAAIQQNNTGKAEQHLYSFSRLYRHLLLTADRITCSLEEELEFTENFIIMEQIRFPDLFSFEKSIDSKVDTDIEIPKMAIQCHVENAIKHGLRRRVSGGILKLDLSVSGSVLLISISDNGIGRTEATKLGSDSTGKGNQVMEEYFALFQKITGQKVYSETEDLFDETGHTAGTCVKIFISLPKKDQKDEQKKI
jgi:hypothetical protein